MKLKGFIRGAAYAMAMFAMVLAAMNLSGSCWAQVSVAVHGEAANSRPMPRLEHRDGHYALMVDGKPFLMLGAQINNSSAWPSTLPEVWPALAAMHVNTVEAPVYWEAMEPSQGSFDFANVDALIEGARAHHLRLVLLWFGTWKNGQMHYIPEWMKSDTVKYPRERNAYGKVIDVLSPHSSANLAADASAFAALMRHVKQVDGDQRTVIMVQVENESGSVGSVRDYSPLANQQFAGSVPASLHMGEGSWRKVFGADAEERFAAFATASYIDKVAAAGKAEYALPMYCNVWITYPVHALENRDRASAGAGQDYPSGGPQQQNIDLWKAAAPSIDVLGPDFYSGDASLYREIVDTYDRKDNPVFVPETQLSPDFGAKLFYALGHGAIGFSPFGIDYTNWTLTEPKVPESLSQNFALLLPVEQQIAQWNFEGKLHTAVEKKGAPRDRLHLGDVDAVVSYGFPQGDGAVPPGTTDAHGRALIAQLGPMEFVVTGFDASVSFVVGQDSEAGSRAESRKAGAAQHNTQLEILRAEEGRFVDGNWQRSRIWNGDQTDRGLNFRGSNESIVRIWLHAIPLIDPQSGSR